MLLKRRAECTAIETDAQRDLDEALPALDAAVKCLNALKPSDITEVKSLQKPPAGVKLTAEATCIMFQIKPDRIKDPEGGSKKVNDYFTPAKKGLFADPKKFIQQLVGFDKDNIPDSVITKIEPYIVRPDFTPEAISKASKACTAVCMWVRAMHKYHHVALRVEPLRQKLAAAQAELAVTMEILKEAQAKLKAVTDKIDKLEADFNEATARKNSSRTRWRPVPCG